MEIACLDLEGVLVPEIWIGVANNTGIEALSATTRDVPDYDELMRQRLAILKEHGLRLPDIEQVIAGLSPLPGAVEFLDWMRERFQVVILSDTFYEFAQPLMRQLGHPTLLCHRLTIDGEQNVVDYRLRQVDPKRKSVQALKSLQYRIIASGDSYNDLSMLEEADAGILYCPPASVVRDYPQYPVARDYLQLRDQFLIASDRY